MKIFRYILGAIWEGNKSEEPLYDDLLQPDSSHQIPESLLNLIKTCVWPKEGANTMDQEFNPIVRSEYVEKISADDTKLILHAPPFHTIQQAISYGEQFWTRDLTNLGEIDYSQAVIIADFGMGSDSVVILYYSVGNEPSVKYLKWSGNGADIRHTWSHIDDNFNDFAIKIGLLGDRV